jgi:hypothetical protein
MDNSTSILSRVWSSMRAWDAWDQGMHRMRVSLGGMGMHGRERDVSADVGACVGVVVAIVAFMVLHY